MATDQSVLPPHLREWSRGIEIASGILVLMIANVAFAMFLGTLYLVGQMDAVNPNQEDLWALWRIFRRVGYVAALLGVGYLGLALLEGKQLCVLYLRRFRLNVNAISPTDHGGLGRRVRIFTLDDREFVPAEVPRVDKWLTRLGPVFVLVVVTLLAKLLSDELLTGFSEGNDANWSAMVVFLGFCAGIFSLILAMLLLHRFRLRQGGTIYVKAAADIHTAAAAMYAASTWWTRPALLSRQATVVSVSQELWQEAVRVLARQANCVVMDVSEPSENVIWELNILTNAGISHVPVAEQERWRRIPPDTQRLVCNSGHEVLTYEPSDQVQLKSFRRRVTKALFDISRPMPKLARNWSERIRSSTKLASFYGVAFALAAAIGFFVGFLCSEAAFLLVGN